MREARPTIKLLATEFAQRLLDRGRSDNGLGTVSFEELIGMRRSGGFRPRLPTQHDVIMNSSVGDTNSWFIGDFCAGCNHVKSFSVKKSRIRVEFRSPVPINIAF